MKRHHTNLPGFPIATVAYVDTAALLCPGKRNETMARNLRPLCRKARTVPSKCHGHHRLIVDGPQPDAYAGMATIEEAQVAEVHVAADLLVATQAEADALHGWVHERITGRFRRAQPTGSYRKTEYSTRRRWRCKSTVTYSDRPSRITGQPCLHAEFRVKGVGVCRAGGFEAVGDLQRLDPAAWWLKQLQLRDIDYGMLGRQWRLRSKAFDYDPEDREFGLTLAAFAAAQQRPDLFRPDPTAQMTLDHYRGQRWFRHETALPKIPNGEVVAMAA